MHEWRELRKNQEIFEYVEEIWRKEETLPRFFRDSSKCWTSTLEDFTQFVSECGEIFGLFDGEKLCACVYIEQQSIPTVASIHLSIISKIKPSIFIEKSAELRNLLFRRGIKIIRGWVLKRNFALCRLLTEIGFRPNELVQDYGTSHGQVLRWCMVEVARG